MTDAADGRCIAARTAGAICHCEATPVVVAISCTDTCHCETPKGSWQSFVKPNFRLPRRACALLAMTRKGTAATDVSLRGRLRRPWQSPVRPNSRLPRRFAPRNDKERDCGNRHVIARAASPPVAISCKTLHQIAASGLRPPRNDKERDCGNRRVIARAASPPVAIFCTDNCHCEGGFAARGNLL